MTTEQKTLHDPRVWAEYVDEDGMPTGEAWLVVSEGTAERWRLLLSPEDAQTLGDLLVQISSARPKASPDNFPNAEGAGI